jgi:hypothetical protein
LNAKVRSDNTTGFAGVYRDKARGKYYARPMRDGIRVNLGYFDTLEKAVQALIDWDA